MPSTNGHEPVAIVVYKRGRRCTMAKRVFLDGEPVLAIPFKNRCTQRLISLPVCVLRWAEAEGVTAIVVRHDYEQRAWRMPLAKAMRGLVVTEEAGLPERAWTLAEMEEMHQCPTWPFAIKTVVLGPPPEARPRQLELGI